MLRFGRRPSSATISPVLHISSTEKGGKKGEKKEGKKERKEGGFGDVEEVFMSSITSPVFSFLGGGGEKGKKEKKRRKEGETVLLEDIKYFFYITTTLSYCAEKIGEGRGGKRKGGKEGGEKEGGDGVSALA